MVYSEPPISSGPASAEELLGAARKLVSDLMRSKALERGDVDVAVGQLTETAASALRVERVSVWTFDDVGDLVCKDLFELRPARHSSGQRLRPQHLPAYFAALDDERTVTAHDVRTDPRTRELSDDYLVPFGITSMLDAPIHIDGELVGVVCLEHVGPKRRWAEHEELLAGTFADFVALVIGAAERHEHRMRLEHLVEQRTNELRASELAFRQLFDTSPVAMIVTRVADNRIVMANPRASELFGVPQAEVTQQFGRDYWLDQDERSRLLGILQEKGFAEDFEARLRTKEGGHIWVTIAVRTITLNGEAVMLTGARDISERKKMEQRLQELATIDELTGALNRRRLLEAIQEEIERATRYERPLCAALLDVDHFKEINDRYGHLAGDETLRHVVRGMRDGVRRSDHIGRYGGEELMIVFPETPRDAAVGVVERIRGHIEGLGVFTEKTTLRVTVSAGVVQWQPGESITDLVRRADAAMYEAKSKGRNRIVAA